MTAVSEGDVGRVLNQRYRLSRSLGRGGMGEVWLAVDTALGREVAVKELLLPPSLDEAAQRSWLERSKREATAAARIRHENVVTVHDVFEEDGRPWIVMELVISRSLAEVIRSEGRLEFAEAARIGLDVLRALRAAHAKGVLHRDVKPANVLLGLDGRVVLTDFGIATFADAPQVTQVGELLGTPGYLAPERAERFTAGRPEDVPGADAATMSTSAATPLDPASDLWSLGATLYEIVEGRPPFSRASPVEVVEAVVRHDPHPPRYAGDLEPVVLGLLRKDPVARMDAKEAEELLTRVIQDGLAPTWGGEVLPSPRKPAGGAAPVEPTWAGDGPSGPQEGAGGGSGATRGGAGDGGAGGGAPRSRKRRLYAVIGAVVALVLIAVTVAVISAVGKDGKDDPLADVKARSETFKAMVQRGYVIVGVKPDQPGLSEKGADGQYAGFDDEIARMVAADLGFANRIRFVDVETQGREYRIASGQVDLVVASYTINPDRLTRVSFAGPYYVAGQDFLVRKEDQDAKRPEDLAGSSVCVVRESTSAARVRQKFPTMQVSERGKYSECVDELLQNKVRAVSTDDTILAGFVAQHPAELRVLGSPFSDEPYGIGLTRGDTALANAVCKALNRHVANGDWQRAYDATLGPLGLLQPRPPKCAAQAG
ncbi:bifunctional serine/threonine-protein kinase/glutamate ABC transporter substrate-binding protein [Yinghuangia seranimata]|uniref:bifunctional serine/threonine-protein kinase/glutamate ABC transporter substrate-binding protein n=1 Tax=Yinghuangia seranimata TaxID=408067 RepID=UPI00248CB194|nr:bifunctional serine/threonine-protein kinase/glutamate ABC transporter substrate-binding protein [Yinghuangia seranimata]MDI2128626.1 bifunctional serine/threonine-protein kinase/glutamate ABC transporter substrate-binding protein [Yinghuangia seranimata]